MLTKSMVHVGKIVDLTPSQPKIVGDCQDATWREREVSPKYHDNDPLIGRGLVDRNGVGESRILCCLRFGGLTPKQIMAKARK
jgi:hypothetical protein